MKLSENWLRQWVNPKLTTAELADQLTMAGLEVDSVMPAAPAFSGVVVGHVLSREPHPNADKLSVCQVDVGESVPLAIVCGAANVRADIKVPVATVGGVLPGEFKIKKAKLRGEPSHGMICAGRELGIDDGVDGIMILPPDAPVGMDFREYFALDDHVIDIELTPNRGDCASLRGLARELGVLNALNVNALSIKPVKPQQKIQHGVTVKAKTACPRYVGRVIQNIQTGIATPQWLVARLQKSGIRAIHPVVDVCNYVMIELGQPMHAFDLAKLTGDIHVRYATSGETLALLDEQQAELADTDLVIADDNRALAIAGIMGGADSGVTTTTQDIFLESAFFDPVGVSLTARRLGIITDSAYRFERGVDSALQTEAIERATALLLDIVGGEPGPVVEVASQSDLPTTPTLSLIKAHIPRLLGIEIPDKAVTQILTALGFIVEATKTGWTVSAPTHRFDITEEADLIEELARIYGYEKIPATNMSATLSLPAGSSIALSRTRIADALVDRGYQEAITYSFIDAQLSDLITPSADVITLNNPIASDMNVMRRTVWPGLLTVMIHNQNRQSVRQRLFEMGLCFQKTDDGLEQVAYLGMLAVGSLYPEQWALAKRSVDFYDVKGDVEALLTLSGLNDWHWLPGTSPALHPGQSADLYRGDTAVGHLGVLHPKLVKKLSLKQSPVLFEGVLAGLQASELAKYSPLSKYPAVRRDLALVVDEGINASAILALIKKNSGAFLTDIQIFDIYQGESVEKGKKSVALGLTFQDPSRTLVDTDINAVIQCIINALESEFKATLRM